MATRNYSATRLALALGALSFFLPLVAGAQAKSLQRVDDPLVLEGKRFPQLYRTPLDRLTLLARRDGQWQPIPFQVDEKKPDGNYCFTAGPDAAPDPEPGLDANDELAFMVKDAGDRTDGQLPPGASAALEIALRDPKTGGQGWAYFCAYPKNPPRTETDYIQVELSQGGAYRKVITYEYIMGGPSDRIYPDLMAAHRPDGSQGADVLDRLKMRGKIVLPLGLSFNLAFDDISQSEDRGWIDGPIRVLHYAQGYVAVSDYFKLPLLGHSMISYYVNHMIWPLSIQLPASSGRSAIKTENFRGYMDFCPAVYGSHPFSAPNPYHPDFLLDGKTSEAEKHLNTTTHMTWNAGFGPEGALVSRLFNLPDTGRVKQYQFYQDDATASDPPENCPGVTAVGYVISTDPGYQEPATTYQYYYYLRELQPADVQRILDILDHPVAAEVRPLADSTTARTSPPAAH